MKRTIILKACFILIAAVLVCGCRKPQQEESEEEILARIGDVKISVKEFQDTINSYTPYLRSKYNTPEMKKRKLEEMVRFELLAMEAKKRGYDKDPMVQRALRQSLIRELLIVEVEDKVKLEDISEEEMKKYYEDHPEKYHKPAQRRVAHILVKDKALADKILADVLNDEMNAVKFRDLVIRHSEDPVNKTHGGDMGYFSSPEERTEHEPPIDDKILKALYGLEKVGEVYKEVIEMDEGFHIIKYTSTKPETHRTYDQVKRQIQSILWKQKREEAKEKFIEALRKKADVKINEKLFDKIQIPEPSGSKMGMGGAGPPKTPMDIAPPPGPSAPAKPKVKPAEPKEGAPAETGN